MDRREFFDRQARDWESTPGPQQPWRLERVAALADLQPGHRVLDVGTGTGVLLPHLLQAVGEMGRIVALDISPKMLASARAKGFPSNVTFLEADVQRLPLPDKSFDRVICNAAFPHFPDRQKALSEMIRVLRPDGLLIISHPIGREAVNALHRETGGVVGEDRVPPGAEMQRLLLEAGLGDVLAIDEPVFYLAAGRRPRGSERFRGGQKRD